jgi:hypothetical protein
MHRARLVHANAVATLPSVIPAARTLGVPVVAHLHLPMSADERLHSWLHQVSAAVGVSRYVTHGLIEDGMRPEHVRVIYNAVDGERFLQGDALALRRTLGIDQTTLVLAAVGSLIERKRQRIVLEGLACARAQGIAAHLLVCGEGEDREALERRTAALGLAKAVTFLGERRDVGAVLRDAVDVFISAAAQEAMPLNVLEAQLAGVPVIASDIEPHREALAVGTTGILFTLDDATSLADCITMMARQPDLRRQLGENGKQRAAREFGIARYVHEFEALYSAMVHEPPRAYGWCRSRWPRVYGQWLRRTVRRRLPSAVGGTKSA